MFLRSIGRVTKKEKMHTVTRHEKEPSTAVSTALEMKEASKVAHGEKTSSKKHYKLDMD